MKKKLVTWILVVVMGLSPESYAFAKASDVQIDAYEEIEDISDGEKDKENTDDSEKFKNDYTAQEFDDGQSVDEFDIDSVGKQDFSDDGILFGDGSDNDPETGYETEEIPNQDVWLAKVVRNGFFVDGIQMGESAYKILTGGQEPVYAELGAAVLDNKPLVFISAAWKNMVKREFYDDQKSIYIALLMEYLKYGAYEDGSVFDTEIIEKENAYLITIFKGIEGQYEQEGIYNWTPEEINNIPIGEAAEMLKKIKAVKYGVDIATNVASTTKELIKYSVEMEVLRNVVEEKAQVIENARIACAEMDEPNSDFIQACDEVLYNLDKINTNPEYNKSYLAENMVSLMAEKVLKITWKELVKENLPLKIIDFGASTLDLIFNSDENANQNLKLSLLYTMDFYMKMGMHNTSMAFARDESVENAQAFIGCYKGYLKFQKFGNETAKSWISNIINGRAINYLLTYIFYRENLKTAADLTALCNAQNMTKTSLIELVGKYMKIYDKWYMKQEYRDAMDITMVPDVKPEECVTEISSVPRPVRAMGNCGERVSWCLFEDGTLLVYGAGKMRDYMNTRKPAWFEYKDEIGEIQITSEVKHVGSYAFAECQNVKKVSFSDRVESIGDNAFAYCNGITDIVFPNSLTDIGRFAFMGCRSISEVNIPDRVHNLSGGIFCDCTNLKSVILPEELIYMGESSFARCSNLENIIIPGEITKIETSTFQDCCNLKSIQLPEKLEAIDAAAFTGCESLDSIKLPKNLQIMGHDCFSQTGLKTVVIPDSVEDIGEAAFSQCKKLESLKLPSGIKKLSPGMFFECDELRMIEIPDNVMEIGRSAFWECHNLQKLSLPENLISLGEYVFYNCSALEYVHFPDKMKVIGTSSFEGCKNLKEISFSNGIEMISDRAFWGCESLETIKLPEQLKSMGNKTFENCTHLYNVVINEQLQEIRQECFANCSKLRSISGMEGLVVIGPGAFSDCTELNSIDWNGKLRKIDNRAFAGCYGLEKLNFSEGLVVIGDEAFAYCTELISVAVPASLQYMGERGFLGCEKLKTVNFSEGLKNIATECFRGCSKLKKIELPESLSQIGEKAFYDNDSMVEARIWGSPEFGEMSIGYKDEVINPDFIIYGQRNSSVEKYADVNGITFVNIMEDPVLTIIPVVTPEVFPKGKLTVVSTNKYVSYNGKFQKPEVRVKYNGKTLSVRNYTVKYKDNKKVGIATIFVKGKGKYANCSGKTTFRIVLSKGAILSAKSGKKCFDLKWKKILGCDGYEIQYSTNAHFSRKKIKKIKGYSNTNITIRKLKPKKYYIRIRAYKKNGKSVCYGKWSKVASIKVK